MGLLACDGCGDGGAGASLIAAVPFVFYWLWTYLIWALPVGLPIAIVAACARVRLPLGPMRFFLASIPVYIVLHIFSGFGNFSYVAPLVVILPFWMYRLARNARPPARAEGDAGPPAPVLVVAARINRAFLAAGVLLVPVAYLRFHLQQTHPAALPDLLAALGTLF